jgi:acyl-CoA synthetase (AMP-forming)/AMP-acid ligase II
MFNSGSTSPLKGVQISHRLLCLYLRISTVNMDIGPGDRLLHNLSAAFDGKSSLSCILSCVNALVACACVLFSTLCNGSTVVPAEPADLYQKATSCTVMAATPSLLNNLPSPSSEDTMFSNIHTVLPGSETASPDLPRSWVVAGVRILRCTDCPRRHQCARFTE